MATVHPDVARAIRTEGRGSARVVVKAAYATNIVEAGGQNPRYGDRDSLGSFQQRPSQGWGTPAQVMDPRYAARQFISRARKIHWQHPDWNSAQIAQAVQRSAFPERYAAHDVQVAAQRLSRGGSGGAEPGSFRLRGRGSTDVSLERHTIPGQSFAEERQAERRALFLGSGDLSMDKLLSYKQRTNELQDIPARQVSKLAVRRKTGPALKVPTRESSPRTRALENGGGRIYEVFYDGLPSYWDAGDEHEGQIGGHGDHVHVSGTPKYLIRLGRLAQGMGLAVGENANFGGVGGGHTEGSFHYRKGGTEAIDVSGGTPAKRAKFARIVMEEARRGRGR